MNTHNCWIWIETYPNCLSLWILNIIVCNQLSTSQVLTTYESISFLKVGAQYSYPWIWKLSNYMYFFITFWKNNEKFAKECLTPKLSIAINIYCSFDSCLTKLVKFIICLKKRSNGFNFRISTIVFKYVKSTKKFQGYLMFWTGFIF